MERPLRPTETGATRMDAQWQIDLLGGLCAVHRDRVVTRFRYQTAAALLAYLAYYRERAHPRAELIDRLWPECPPEVGRSRLSTSLSSLRHQLEPLGVPPHAVLGADRMSLRLNPAAVTTDVAEFEAALGAGARASRGPQRAQLLAEAVDRYHGELLPGYFAERLRPERHPSP